MSSATISTGSCTGVENALNTAVCSSENSARTVSTAPSEACTPGKMLFSMHAVFQVGAPLPSSEEECAELVSMLEQELGAYSVSVRGWYDLAGFRSDADLLVWLVSPRACQLQKAYHAITNSRLGAYLVPAWSGISGIPIPGAFSKKFNTRATVLAGTDCLTDASAMEHLTLLPLITTLNLYNMESEDTSIPQAKSLEWNEIFEGFLVSELLGYGCGEYASLLAIEGKTRGDLIMAQQNIFSGDAMQILSPAIGVYAGKRLSLAEWIAQQPTDSVLE